MRIALRFSILWLSLAAASVPAQTDKLTQALDALAGDDTAKCEQAEKYLSKNVQEATPRLHGLLQDSSRPPVARLRAAKLLGDLGDASAVDVMKNVLSKGCEHNAAVRVEIIRSLTKLGRRDVVLDYFNSGTEHSPSVNAAIAISLQRGGNDESKKALSKLLRNSDRRVVEAAIQAVSQAYKLVTGQPGNKPSTKHGPQPELAQPSECKPDSTPGDRAIFEALQSLQSAPANSDPQIRQGAAALLTAMHRPCEQK